MCCACKAIASSATSCGMPPSSLSVPLVRTSPLHQACRSVESLCDQAANCHVPVFDLAAEWLVPVFDLAAEWCLFAFDLAADCQVPAFDWTGQCHKSKLVGVL